MPCSNGKVLLCAIGKLENDYILEWVEHYKSYHFDNICLYDNNDIDGERFEDVIQQHIDDGFVIMRDVRGKQTYQISSYNMCYDEFKDKYEFIAFFDIDEFIRLSPKYCNDIHNFVSDKMFSRFNMIRICWENFDDNGHTCVVDGNYSISRFTHHTNGNNQSKAIIRTTVPKLNTTSPHILSDKTKFFPCNAVGKKCSLEILMKEGTTIMNANLSHYRFKTIEEYVTKKMVRLWPTKYCNNGKGKLNLDFFFQYNKKTPEKVECARRLMEKSMEENTAIVNGWFHYDKNGKMINYNWGDDINYHFIKEIVDERRVVPYNQSKHSKYTNYQLIGSIVGNTTNGNTVIWGAGIPDYSTKVLSKPKDVLAVRGPLTRNILIKNGIDAPEVYGDPALLLPYFYRPEMELRNKIAFIPHWSSISSPIVRKISSFDGVKVINLHSYSKWTDVIDELLSSEYVVSESLHGLILAEAYGKRNAWVRITFDRQKMKYKDFFLSIGDKREEPYKIMPQTTMKSLIDMCESYECNDGIDLEPLVMSCPFKLTDEFMEKFNNR